MDEYKGIPKTYRENLEWRVRTQKLCFDDELTRAAHYEMCRRDILYWFNGFAWTYDPRKTPSELPFITYDFQDDVIEWFDDMYYKRLPNRDGIITKSRDMGCSWLFLLWCQYHFLFDLNFQALIGSKTEEGADRKGDMASLFEKLRFNLNLLPLWMYPSKFNESKHNLYLRLLNPDNGNAITGESTTQYFSRKGRYGIIFVDEYAFIDPQMQETIWMSMGDSTPVRVAVSTYNGVGNKYYALSNNANINKIVLHWSLHPEKGFNFYKSANGKIRSPWYDNECERRSEDEVRQELDCIALGSGRPFFESKSLEEIRAKYLIKPMYVCDIVDTNEMSYNPDRQSWNISDLVSSYKFDNNQDGALKFFEYPDVEAQYTIGADIAEGLVKKDRSVAVVLNIKTLKIVAIWAGYQDPDLFALTLSRLGTYYNNAFLVVERNTYGLAVNSSLVKELEYDNLFYEVILDKESEEETKKYGFQTSVKSRPVLLNSLKRLIREHPQTVVSDEVLRELETFVIDDNGKPGAEKGALDDLVIGLALAYFGTEKVVYLDRIQEPNYLKERRTKNMFKKFVDRMF